MARTRRILLWVVGSLGTLVVVVLLVGLWFANSLYQSEQTNQAEALAAFADVRSQFTGAAPAFEIRDDRIVVVRMPPTSPASPPTALRLLVWTPRERTLSRVRLPFGISVIATEPVPLEALIGVANQGLGALMEAKRRGNELNVRLSDLEAYGRTLLLDGVSPDGRQILMWNE